MNVKNLKNRVVLITGAGSGMGRATALACARRGARLAICDMNEAGLKETAEGRPRSSAPRCSRRPSTSATPMKWTNSPTPCTPASTRWIC